MTFSEAVADLYYCGFVTLPVPVAPNVYHCSHTGHGFQAAAREIARNLPGQVWPGRRGFSWVCGGGGPHGVVFDSGDLAKLHAAQDRLADLGLDRNVWSLGRAARLLLHFVAPGAKAGPGRSAERLLEGIEVGYHDCIPGEYPSATMYDVRAYYYSLLTRLPSLRVGVLGGKVEFYPMSADERARWREVLEVVNEQKVLRNSIFGAAMGKTGKSTVFHRDKARPGKVRERRLQLPPGPFRGAGLLVARTAWELCRDASEETDSVYSTVDSVTTRSGSEPQTWKGLGLIPERCHEGRAHICGLGSWRIGDAHEGTKPYRAGMRQPRPVERHERPQVAYGRAWLV